MKNGDKSAYGIQAYYHEQFGPVPQESGLTKREMFAMAAMQGILANSNDRSPIEYVVRESVKASDALLNELEK